MTRKKTKGPAVKAQKKKAWGSKQVLASSFAQSFPSPAPNALETTLRHLISLFPEPIIKRIPRPPRSSSTPSPSPTHQSKKPKHMVFGLNEVTRKLEKKLLSLVVVARDVTPALLVSHIPMLCYLSGAELVVLPGDGKEVAEVFGMGRVLTFGIEREGEGISERVKDGLKGVAVTLKFDWVEAGRGKVRVEMQEVVMRKHRNKEEIRRESVG